MFKAAIIGAGFISSFHAHAYRENPDTELIAVCDTELEKAQALAGEYGCKAYKDARKMLEEEKPDIVSVCLPTFLHEEYTLLALEHGANVLCEKPLSLSMDSCRRMADAAEKCGRMLMTGQVLRWWPEYAAIAKNMAHLGKPYSVLTQRLQHPTKLRWVMDPEKGGGVLFDLFIHDLDFVCSMFGYQPDILACRGQKAEQGSYRSVGALLKWEETTAYLEASNLLPPHYPFTAAFRADFPEACIRYQFNAPVNIQANAKTETFFMVYEQGEAFPQPISSNAQLEAFQNELNAFIDGVRTGVSPNPVQNTIQVLEIVHAIKNRLDKALDYEE